MIPPPRLGCCPPVRRGPHGDPPSPRRAGGGTAAPPPGPGSPNGMRGWRASGLRDAYIDASSYDADAAVQNRAETRRRGGRQRRRRCAGRAAGTVRHPQWAARTEHGRPRGASDGTAFAVGGGRDSLRRGSANVGGGGGHKVGTTAGASTANGCLCQNFPVRPRNGETSSGRMHTCMCMLYLCYCGSGWSSMCV